TSETSDRVQITEDGGATWTYKTFGRDALPGIPDFAVIGQMVWLVGGLSFPTHGDGTVLASSSDAGASWTVNRVMDKAHDFKSGQLRGIAAVSASDIWVAGEARQIYHTVDGGMSWKQVTGVPDTISRFGDIAVDGQHVVAGANLVNNGVGIYEST